MENRGAIFICFVALMIIISFYLATPPVERVSRALGFTSTPTAEQPTDTPTPRPSTETPTPGQPMGTPTPKAPTDTPAPAPTVENTPTPSPTPSPTPEPSKPDDDTKPKLAVTPTPVPLMPLSGGEARRESRAGWLWAFLALIVLLVGCPRRETLI